MCALHHGTRTLLRWLWGNIPGVTDARICSTQCIYRYCRLYEHCTPPNVLLVTNAGCVRCAQPWLIHEPRLRHVSRVAFRELSGIVIRYCQRVSLSTIKTSLSLSLYSGLSRDKCKNKTRDCMRSCDGPFDRVMGISLCAFRRFQACLYHSLQTPSQDCNKDNTQHTPVPSRCVCTSHVNRDSRPLELMQSKVYPHETTS